MARLPLTLACGDYDRTHALVTGTVRPEGIDLNFVPLSPAEIFWRMLRHAEFDASELSLSGYVMGLSRGDTRFIAIPVFPLRLFRHSYIWFNAGSGVEQPSDLAGKRIGIPEYHMTALLYIRGMLHHDHGVRAEDVRWVRGRTERVELRLPPSVELTDLQPGQSMDDLLERGELDAVAGTRAPRAFHRGGSRIRRLFEDPRATEIEYFRRTGIFPIMHVVVLRREIYEEHRWVAASLAKAFQDAKDEAYRRIEETSSIYSLPFLQFDLEESRRVFNGDPFLYGVERNRPTLEAAVQYSQEQYLSDRPVSVEELFAPETVDAFTGH